MQFEQNPSAQPPGVMHPQIRTRQRVVLWPDPVGSTQEPRPIIGAVRDIDEETGRILVDTPAIRADAIAEVGSGVVLMAAQVGNGIYYRHCVVDVQRAISNQASLTAIVLNATDDWRRMEHRQAERATVSIVLADAKRYPAAGGFRRIAATVRNISTSGLLLETGDPLEMDDRLELYIPLSDGKPPLAVRATVIRTLVSPARAGVRFAGCRFEGLHATDQSRIRVAMPALPAGSPFIG
jgi:hypothetical protein